MRPYMAPAPPQQAPGYPPVQGYPPPGVGYPPAPYYPGQSQGYPPIRGYPPTPSYQGYGSWPPTQPTQPGQAGSPVPPGYAPYAYPGYAYPYPYAYAPPQPKRDGYLFGVGIASFIGSMLVILAGLISLLLLSFLPAVSRFKTSPIRASLQSRLPWLPTFLWTPAGRLRLLRRVSRWATNSWGITLSLPPIAAMATLAAEVRFWSKRSMLARRPLR